MFLLSMLFLLLLQLVSEFLAQQQVAQQPLLIHPSPYHPYNSSSSSPSSSHFFYIFPNVASQQRASPVYSYSYHYPCLSRCPQGQHYRWTTYNGKWPANNGTNGRPAISAVGYPQQPSVQGAYVRLILPATTTGPATTTSTAASSTTMEPKTSRQPSLVITGYTIHHTLPTPPPYSPRQNGPADINTIVRLNPCPHGEPLANAMRNPTTCNFVVPPNGGCPEGYWCHTGSSYEATTCCPAAGGNEDRCQLPRNIGEGEDLIPRWYFDSGARKCKRFLYKGIKGNANNFVTAMSCAESCETADNTASAAAARNPCAIGPPARDLNGEQFSCGHSDGRCPAGYYCHLGEAPEGDGNVCCELSAAASDRCNLALRTGDGPAHLRRFYFNTVTRRCVEFEYRGAKGNENQFLTMAECRKECEKPPNPCPVLFDFGIRKECQGEQQRCGRGEWCHRGSGAETTACCAGAVEDPCKLPLDLGHGLENLTRWYAIPSEDPCQRECRPFQYRGMKGNQNNFVTKADCEANCKAECPSALNPCGSEEELLLDPEGRAQRCNGTGESCPAEYWCHVGPNPETTVCCSGATRSCTLPLKEGVGNALLKRWYYNARERNCQKFTYRGIGGNQNNYVDYEECMNACPDEEASTTTPTAPQSPATTAQSPSASPPDSSLSPLAANPCGTGSPLLNSDAVMPRECSPRRRCPPTHFCHIGGDPERQPNICCPKNGDPCEQPLAPGDGPFELARWHFDATARRCRPFTYRGAGGNANNFLTAEDCELICPAVAALPNPCPEGEPLADDRGQPLVCGGSGGAESGANSVLAPLLAGAAQAQARAGAGGCPPGWWCHVGASPATTNCCPVANAADQSDDQGPCELPLALGTGTQRLDRWYFDAGAQACRRFWYTGLKGNANNFVSREHCQQSCLVELANFGGAPGPIPEPDPEPCLRGALLRDSRDHPLRCSQHVQEDCPADTHFCHIGHRPSESGCCPRTSPVTDPCLLPLNRGVGGARAPTQIRWHWNAATRRCEAFDYTGRKGNENNWLTKRQCEEKCRGERPKKPRVEAALAPKCPHGEPMWEADGQGGRKAAKCAAGNQCPEGYICHLDTDAGRTICCENPAHFCLQARDHGPCHGTHRRFGYNPLTDTCVEYQYGGCRGTLNNFESREKCTEICCRQFRSRRMTGRGR